MGRPSGRGVTRALRWAMTEALPLFTEFTRVPSRRLRSVTRRFAVSSTDTAVQSFPPLDTHALVQRLQGAGLSLSQAEEATAHMCTVITGTLERLEAKFLSRTEAERVRSVLQRYPAFSGASERDSRRRPRRRHNTMQRLVSLRLSYGVLLKGGRLPAAET